MPKAEAGTFGDGRIRYEAETRNGYTSKKKRLVKLAPLSIAYRLRCLECLMRSLAEAFGFVNAGDNPKNFWAELDEEKQKVVYEKVNGIKVDSITRQICEDWQAKYSSRYSPTVFNNTLNTFRRV